MSNEEAIRLLKNLPTMCVFKDAFGKRVDSESYYKAVDMAVKTMKESGKIKNMVYTLAGYLRTPLLYPCSALPNEWCKEHCIDGQPSKECWIKKWAEEERLMER